ncbi:MAG: T9SS type B sorting domain-containing protein [Bacteroidota bacterium]
MRKIIIVFMLCPLLFTACKKYDANSTDEEPLVKTILVNSDIPDMRVPFGSKITLDATMPGATAYLWTQAGETSPTILWDGHTPEIIVQIMASGQLHSYTVEIMYDQAFVWCPTTFTPNGDGRNDFWYPILHLVPENGFKLSIFNSDMKLMFYSEDIYKCRWNGKSNDVLQPVETYYFTLQYYNNQQKKCTSSGQFLLCK